MEKYAECNRKLLKNNKTYRQTVEGIRQQSRKKHEVLFRNDCRVFFEKLGQKSWILFLVYLTQPTL